MSDAETTENSFTLSRPVVNAIVAVLVLLAGAIYYSFYLAGHVAEGTVFTLHNVHDLSDAMLAPILTLMIMLLFTHKTLGRFLTRTYLVLLGIGVAASFANAMIFDRFGFTQYDILPRVLYTVPADRALHGSRCGVHQRRSHRARTEGEDAATSRWRYRLLPGTLELDPAGVAVIQEAMRREGEGEITFSAGGPTEERM